MVSSVCISVVKTVLSVKNQSHSGDWLGGNSEASVGESAIEDISYHKKGQSTGTHKTNKQIEIESAITRSEEKKLKDDDEMA